MGGGVSNSDSNHLKVGIFTHFQRQCNFTCVNSHINKCADIKTCF